MPLQIVIPSKTPLTPLDGTNDIPSRLLVSHPNNFIDKVNNLDLLFPPLWRSRSSMNQLMPLQNLLEPKRLSTPLKPTNKRLVMLMCCPDMTLQREWLSINP